MKTENIRPNPDKLLEKITAYNAGLNRGKLKIFFGACPGVGKTYAMLVDAKLQLDDGVDVVAGVVETHGRDATANLLDLIPIIPAKESVYKDIKIVELDIDEILKRKPRLVLIDELAHTNAPESRHPKRWNDVEEILNAGINVYSTLNVQHLESLNDLVESITKIRVRETVPDSIFDNADDIVLVDINADELLSRLKKGQVYINPQSRLNAATNFFKKENIIALRELALRRTAQRVDAQMEDYVIREGIKESSGTAKKIMVCIGPNSISAKLIRSAKRMANSLKVPWTACYVENSRHYRLSEKERTIVDLYLSMAKRNGAETIVLYGEHAASEILSYARLKNVNKIIVGKSNKNRFREIIYGSLATKIIRKSGAADVYVITDDVNEKSPTSFNQKLTIADLGNYGGALFAVIICTLFGKIFDNFFEDTDQIMIYLIGAVLVASRFGRVSSILFSILAVGAFNFFFVEPHFTFSVIDKDYWLTFLVMFITSLFIATLTAKLSTQAFILRKREQDTGRFYDLTKELSSVKDYKKIAEISAQKISESFDSKVAIWLIKNDSSSDLEIIFEDSGKSLNKKEQAVAAWCYMNKKISGRQTDTMPSAHGLYLPLMILENVIGVIGIYPKNQERNFTNDEKSALETFSSLISSSLQRTLNTLEAEQANIKSETEKLKNILLSSISHDLRTPLSSIIGASESIMNNDKIERESINNLAKSINSESNRLAKIVTNLLDITNIESGNLKLNLQSYYIEEIIGSAIARMDGALKNHKINVACDNDLPMVLIDGVLIEQVITNLLENASKYTPEGSVINIVVQKKIDSLLIEISDNGPGILQSESSDKRDGYGLGLIICQGILKAHNSVLKIEDNVPSGAKFSFGLANFKLENDKQPS